MSTQIRPKSSRTELLINSIIPITGSFVALLNAQINKLYSNGLERLELETDGDLAQNATNGGNLLWTKASTALALSTATGLTAAGTTIADALALTRVYNVLTTVASGAGAKLWDAPVGARLEVVNAGANALLLYPEDAVDATLNGGSIGASVSVAAGSMVICYRVSTTNWIVRELTAPAA